MTVSSTFRSMRFLLEERGQSGMEAYRGFDGSATFSKKKGVLLQNGLVGSFLARALKPPYNSLTDRLIAFLLGRRSKPRSIQRFALVRKE